MAYYYVDSTNGDDTDDGTTMDDGPGAGVGCWATLEHAHAAGLLVAGDIVWVRRIHVEYAGLPVSDINTAYHGTPKDPIRTIGWPRNTHAIASSDWTNGSTAVVVDDADMDREKHQGRFVTGPDGFDYLITRVVDASNIVIDREYASATAANQAATILADEDYALAQAIDDSLWVIKKADYNADADDLPCLDFKDQNFQFKMDTKCLEFMNLEFRDSIDTNGIVYFLSSKVLGFRGCLFHQDQDSEIIKGVSSELTLDRCIIEGSSAGGNQAGIRATVNFSFIIRDSAIWGCGDCGLFLQGAVGFLQNVNIGVEVANEDDDILAYGFVELYGRDVKLGGTNGYIYCSGAYSPNRVSIENYQKILGAHKIISSQGEITKTAADGTGDAPNQRTNGAANVVEVLYNLVSTTNDLPEPISDWTPDVFVHEFEATTDSKSYRYYVQSMAIVTALQLWIEVEYIGAYDDGSEYVISTQQSDEAFTVRADADDWAEYMEVTAIVPAVASKVRIKCKCSFYHATDKIYIDPKVVIS